MLILSIILGILMIIAGACCLFTPLATYLATGYFMCAMMLVFGITGLIRCFMKKANALEIVVSVLAIVVGLIALFVPGSTLVFSTVMLYATAAWFLVMSIVSIVLAFKVKNKDSLWFLLLISGILGVILAIYSFIHPQMLAVSEGMLIGFYFIEIGISTIVMGICQNREQN